MFTMDRLINIAYMTNDRRAFGIHWSAFHSMADRFTQGRNDVVTAIVKHRVKGWEALYEYREQINHLHPAQQRLLSWRVRSDSEAE